ncbi:putative Zinc finger, RanBP2-type [Helianthus annuus]|nr:putative Zinc finger, RanBP2-type [Helianthus annuus]KAJ0531594.1 putative Zinc finger, RanBP2-type [Helianthus annuus]KAJ0698429.1 putative Zinc finger, RanBP2-type [Helianthus annuus]KAJ0881557.1 putative Zinc finger, RanBP2-type [Helianthus annuus]
MFQPKNQKEEKMSSGDWMCGACQHSNFKKRDVCQRCQCPKFATPAEIQTHANKTRVLAGDWYCCCEAHNFANRTECYRCGVHVMMAFNSSSSYPSYDASLLPGGKVGDWMCTRCGGHNFASKVQCFRCKSPRE